MSRDEPVSWFRRHEVHNGGGEQAIHTVSFSGVVNRDQVGDVSVIRGSMRRSPATTEFTLPWTEHPGGQAFLAPSRGEIPGQTALWGYEPQPAGTTVDTLYSSPEHRMTGVPQLLGMMANYADEEGWGEPDPSTALSAYSSHLSTRLTGEDHPSDDPSDRRAYVEDRGGYDSPFGHEQRSAMEEVPAEEVTEGMQTTRRRVKTMRAAQRAESQPTQAQADPMQTSLF